MDIVDIKTLEKKVRNLECPFCSYKAKFVSHYIKHVVNRHPLDKCPVCGYKGRNVLIHLSRQKDRVHRILYAIYGSSTKKCHQRPRKLMKIRSELWVDK